MSASMLQTGVLSGLPQTEVSPSAEAEALARPEPRPASVAEVYETYVGFVFRCLRSLGVRPAHVEDAVQDVFMVVHDKLSAFDGRAKVSTWLYAIVLRIARKYRARQATEAHAEPAEEAAPDNAENALLSRERLRLAHAALSSLSDEKREVFVLAEIEQMSAPEIAAITFTPLNTVYSRLRAARFEFERRIEQLNQRGQADSFGRSR
jgi:RNA polymerase sigma-70 factor (ECF subfamily)